MRLLGDVRLIENEKLAQPTVGTSERSRPQAPPYVGEGPGTHRLCLRCRLLVNHLNKVFALTSCVCWLNTSKFRR